MSKYKAYALCPGVPNNGMRPTADTLHFIYFL